MTRRTLLQRAPLPLLGLGALGLMTRIRSQAQPPQFDPRLETNLLNTTLQTIGHPVPRNFHLLSGYYATFFESLKTTGMLPQLETAFFNSGLLQTISSDQLVSIASSIEQTTGISAATSLPVITGWQTNLPVLNAMLAQSGCDSVHQQIVSFYRSLGDSVRPRDSSTNTPISGGGGGAGGAAPGSYSSATCTMLTLIGLYMGTWGFMSTLGYLTFLSGGVGAVVFAGAGLTLTTISAVGCS